MKLFLKIFALCFIISSVIFFLFFLLPFVIVGGFILSVLAMLFGRRRKVELYTFSDFSEEKDVQRRYSVLSDVNSSSTDDDVIEVKAKEIK